MADPMTVEVVTPEEPLMSGAAEAIVLRTSDGDLTILPGHTPLVTDVVPGLVRVDQEEGEARFAVHGGYLHVDTGPGATEQTPETSTGTASGAGATGEAPSSGGPGPTGAVSTRVRLLAGIAEQADAIDVPRAERARETAESRLGELRAQGRGGEAPAEEGAPGDVEYEQTLGALARAEVRLSVAGGTATSS